MIPIKEILKEIKFRTSRSGGKGGQNVNKVSSKVELVFDVVESESLTQEQKQKVITKLNTKITSDGILSVVEQGDRSQLKNKQQAIKKFIVLLEKCFIEPKKRVKTKVSKAAKEKRLQKKKKHSEKKKLRKLF